MHPEQTDLDTVRAWFMGWGPLVAGQRFAEARALFDPGVIGFGTYMDLVEGLDGLEARQWRAIWPSIADFRFLPETLRIFTSADRLLVTALILWTSTGFREDGTPFPRPGRTTAVLKRAQSGAPWRGIHTHFSEFPAEHAKTFERDVRPTG